MSDSSTEKLFQPIYRNPKSVYHRVVDEIKKSIFEGRMKPGDRLPAERELAEMLGVSRTSVREALKMLAAEGLVSIRHGQGAFISEQDPDEYLKRFASHLPVNRDTVLHLFEVRKVLEPQAARWVAERASQADIQELASMVTTTREQLGRLRSGRLSLLAGHDSNFHYRLAQATGNTVLVRLMHSMLDLLADSRSRSLAIPGRGERSVDEHYEIVKALINRDGEGAAAAMLRHLEDVEEQVVAAWRQG
ncbi:Transcription regulator HTH, GntR [Moorella glycerini]|uniref:HTH-type transcriptional regulator LutR n=1 Tax=Neomoorella stamsii TaxID=1266720 RepID=A0A9X7J2Y2_9FIRM|nr:MULTISPECIES: FadR/GntR family transcriptional regulator [Moorella]PRR73019.1 HTH-type transcriptional regulator LutR [Moorella stamsii]CEP67690.1 Transcription regulator HTH, GntR [Moorella glycerini]